MNQLTIRKRAWNNAPLLRAYKNSGEKGIVHFYSDFVNELVKTDMQKKKQAKLKDEGASEADETSKAGTKTPDEKESPANTDEKSNIETDQKGKEGTEVAPSSGNESPAEEFITLHSGHEYSIKVRSDVEIKNLDIKLDFSSEVEDSIVSLMAQTPEDPTILSYSFPSAVNLDLVKKGVARITLENQNRDPEQNVIRLRDIKIRHNAGTGPVLYFSTIDPITEEPYEIGDMKKALRSSYQYEFDVALDREPEDGQQILLSAGEEGDANRQTVMVSKFRKRSGEYIASAKLNSWDDITEETPVSVKLLHLEEKRHNRQHHQTQIRPSEKVQQSR